eukprot:gene4062-biopygen12383
MKNTMIPNTPATPLALGPQGSPVPLTPNNCAALSLPTNATMQSIGNVPITPPLAAQHVQVDGSRTSPA